MAKGPKRSRATPISTSKENARQESGDEEEFPAERILKEHPTKGYLIEWKGIDPATSKPYEPTWEPRENANSLLKKDWQERKRRRGRSKKPTVFTEVSKSSLQNL